MALEKSPVDAEVRILRDETCYGIALAGRTLVVHWRTETRHEAVLELATLLARLAAEFGSLALLQVIGDQATSPDGATRTALAAMLKDNETRIVASAVAFEGAGFRASVIRSVVIGISMLSRPKCPHMVFASTTAGIEWLSEHMKSSADPRHSAQRMQLAIDELRQRTRPVSP